MSISQVLDFWFGELQDGFARAAQRKRWFTADAEFDAMIASRFGALLADAATGGLTQWQESPRGALAFILVTDQFSRQIHRGSTLAFATDPLALAAARAGLRADYDAALEYDQRAFFYMPFEHSETLADQDMATALFRRLHDEAPAPYRNITERTLQFAEKHREIIARFGRFPHRNATLGRTSTAAEREFLRTASRFGQ